MFEHEFVEELGATRVIHGMIAGNPLEFVTPAAEPLPPAKAFHVAPLTPAVVHVFDPPTGRSMRRVSA